MMRRSPISPKQRKSKPDYDEAFYNKGNSLEALGRYDDAIAAWNRALSGDGDAIDRGDIDRKIRSARQKLPRR